MWTQLNDDHIIRVVLVWFERVEPVIFGNEAVEWDCVSEYAAS